MTRAIGVDGCRAGWFAVLRTDHDWQLHLLPDLAELLSGQVADTRVFIDIPIGLPDSQPRECDSQARRLLTPLRHSSVFSTPVREAVYAPDYLTACRVNARHTGSKLSKQTWNICPKIREVDSFLRRHPEWQSRVYESHPEVAFYGLNRQQPLTATKKSAAGRAQRLALLGAHIKPAKQLFEQALQTYPRKALQADDILDAMVLAVMAGGSEEDLVSLPEPVEQDRYRLPMRIVYNRGTGTRPR